VSDKHADGDEAERTADDETLDAAWGALEEGDVAKARELGKQLGDDSPDALLLLAACAREEMELDQAMAYLRRAIDADPDWASPELWLAEILAADEEQVKEALRHASRATELADDEAEYLSAVALKAGLEAELGEPEKARRTLADLPPAEVALGDPDATLEIADLHLALGDAELARARLQTLTAAAPDFADAWHALGAAAAELGDEREMRDAWRRVWSLDAAPGAEAVPLRRLADAEVAAVAEAALGELPERARELLRGIPIVVAELPAEADVEAGIDPRSLGLFSGTAHSDYSHLGGQPGLTQILLFRRNLERIAGSEDELREEIRMTLIHETGHFFGLDDRELEGLGLG
jgi:predicted Zn-dependent protease with MMP-like domain/Tfp pilus assembly protein PilF